MKIVINKCFGGFGLSLQGKEEYLKLKGRKAYFYKQIKYSWQGGKDEYCRISKGDDNGLFTITSTKDLGDTTTNIPNKHFFSTYDIERTDPDLVKVVEKLKEKSWGKFVELKIVEVPDNTKWYIHEYDEVESINQEHETWD